MNNPNVLYRKLFYLGKIAYSLSIKKKSKIPLFLIYFHNFLKYGTKDMFWAVEIQTSSECNRNCSYCPVSKFPSDKHRMSIVTYKKIIGDLVDMNFNGRISPHFYGEPLLDRRLPQLMQYTRKKLPDSYICILTNGDFLTKELFSYLIVCGVDNFLVTNHEKPSPNIKTLKYLNSKYPDKLHIQNIKEVTLFNRGGLIDIKGGQKLKKCISSSTKLTINYKGDVIICCHDYLGKHIFGNLNMEKISDVWNRKHYRRLRLNNLKGKYEYQLCKSCEFSKYH